MTSNVTSKSNDKFTKATIEIIAVKSDFIFKQDDIGSLVYAPARKFLCFDENVPLYILLHFPSDTAPQLARDISNKIAVQVEAILSDGSQERPNASPRLVRQESYSGKSRPDQGQIIYSKNLDSSILPSICQAEDHIVAVWKHRASLPFTKTRSQVPRISCNASLTLHELGPLDVSRDEGDAYVEEATATKRDKNYNLLRALEYDIPLSKDPPKLTASRVSALAPLVETSQRKIKKSAKRLFPIFSVVKLRIRSFEVPHTSRVILSVDIGIAPENVYPTQLDSVELRVSSAKVRSVCELLYPVKLAKKASQTFSFEVEHDLNGTGVASMPAVLVVQSRPMIHGHIEDANPVVISRWNTSMHLVTDIQPALMARSPSKSGIKGAPPVQRSVSAIAKRRVSQHSTSSVDVSSRTGLLPGTSSLSGLHITIRNPSTGRVGHTLVVEISISNESAISKSLAIEVSRNARRKGLPQIPEVDNRSIILSDAELNALHALHRVESLEFICLSNNTKLTPVAPETSIDATLEYMPLAEGVYTLQDVRIVDLANGTVQEIRQLPSILILQ